MAGNSLVSPDQSFYARYFDGVAGMPMQFSLELASGGKYGYQWAMDQKQTVAEPTEDGLIRELWVEPSYTYDYLAAGGYRYGMVRLEVMVEDEAGNGPSIVQSPAAIFNYLLSSSRSNVVVNDPADPVRVPRVTMTAPHTPSGAQPEPPPIPADYPHSRFCE